MWKNVHLVSGAGIQTHNLLDDKHLTRTSTNLGCFTKKAFALILQTT